LKENSKNSVFCGDLLISQFQEIKKLLNKKALKGIVQEDLTGAKSGINP
jgi:hypothetical protein